MLSPLQCAFCPKVAIFGNKCLEHRYRLRCSAQSCLNQVYARNLCVKHGGKPLCEFPGCSRNVRRHGRCCIHMQNHQERKLCASPGCDKFATSRGSCVRHGGGRQCKWEGCTHYARQGGLCVSHFRARAAIPVLRQLAPIELERPREVWMSDSNDMSFRSSVLEMAHPTPFVPTNDGSYGLTRDAMIQKYSRPSSLQWLLTQNT
ncbi:Aste57867_1713 [Aphanomyces stellatus]|uniref:Aste57867_1713 protein n=1 Tax=Aphanomyces stellatus TaxID=120398 RepID=A0A485K5Y5_9STRA|nr:hypothetical protein As57867_001711 [Aphanomyces stellatus]VFT78924.1 Aste57867_1713 [Aphanomyces stellatus]